MLREVADRTGIPVAYTTGKKEFLDDFLARNPDPAYVGTPVPIDVYMHRDWDSYIQHGLNTTDPRKDLLTSCIPRHQLIHFPKGKVKPEKRCKVRYYYQRESCKGCGLCVWACPKHIIALSKTKINAKGYHPAEVTDMEACIGCTSCARTCPDVVIRIEKD